MSNLDDGQQTLIAGSQVVTMNATRDIIRNGAVVVARRPDRRGRQGSRPRRHVIRRQPGVGGDRFVVTPGLVNTHIHITGEPLTRGYVPDDTPFEENVFVWLCQLYSVYTAAEERLSAQLAAVEMLKSGTTTFLEAGTIRFLDEVVDGLVEVGIRGRVGRWVWDLPPEPGVYRQTTDDAIGHLQRQLDRPEVRRRRIASGRGRSSSATPRAATRLWQAARELATEHGVGMSFHMSPAKLDPDGFIAEFGQRPMIHLDEIGVLGARCRHHALRPRRRQRDRGDGRRPTSRVAHCPTTALKVSYGVTQIGKMPEMVQAGINVAIGTDGNNASNYSDLHRATYLVAGLFKDARTDPQMFPAEMAYEMATLGGARTMLLRERDRLAGARQEGRRRAPRHRPAGVAAAAERDQPARLVGRRPRASTPSSSTAAWSSTPGG